MTKEINECKCTTCQDSPWLETKEFFEHLRTAHGIPKGTTGTRTMITHIDGTDFYDYTYGWEVSGVRFTQHMRSPKNKARR